MTEFKGEMGRERGAPGQPRACWRQGAAHLQGENMEVGLAEQASTPSHFCSHKEIPYPKSSFPTRGFFFLVGPEDTRP